MEAFLSGFFCCRPCIYFIRTLTIFGLTVRSRYVAGCLALTGTGLPPEQPEKQVINAPIGGPLVRLGPVACPVHHLERHLPLSLIPRRFSFFRGPAESLVEIDFPRQIIHRPPPPPFKVYFLKYL